MQKIILIVIWTYCMYQCWIQKTRKLQKQIFWK